MVTNKALSLVVGLALGLPCACNRKQGTNAERTGRAPASTAVSTAAQTRAPAPMAEAPSTREARWHAAMDPASLLLRAAPDASLTAAQKPTVDNLRAELERNQSTDMHPFDTFNADLASGVEAGALDDAKLKSDEAAIDSAMRAHVDTEARILDRLHATLDATQRKAVADAVRAKESARAARRERTAETPADAKRRRVDRMTKELDLDATQQKKIAALIDKDDLDMREEQKKRMTDVLDDFPKDSFDAKDVVEPSSGKTPRDFAEQRAKFVSRVLPILKPEQRPKFAASLRRPWMGTGNEERTSPELGMNDTRGAD